MLRIGEVIGTNPQALPQTNVGAEPGAQPVSKSHLKKIHRDWDTMEWMEMDDEGEAHLVFGTDPMDVPEAQSAEVERRLTERINPYDWRYYPTTTESRIEAIRLHPQALAEVTGKPEVASRTSQFAVRQDGQVVRRYDKNNASEEEEDWDRRYLRRRGVVEAGMRAKLEMTRSMPIEPEPRIPSFDEVFDAEEHARIQEALGEADGHFMFDFDGDAYIRERREAPRAAILPRRDLPQVFVIGKLPPKEPQRPAEEDSLEELREQEEQASRPHNHGRLSSFWLKYGLNRADH